MCVCVCVSESVCARARVFVVYASLVKDHRNFFFYDIMFFFFLFTGFLASFFVSAPN